MNECEKQIEINGGHIAEHHPNDVSEADRNRLKGPDNTEMPELSAEDFRQRVLPWINFLDLHFILGRDFTTYLFKSTVLSLLAGCFLL